MDDDIMLNVVSKSRSKQIKRNGQFFKDQSDNKMSKTDAKKMKYTMKMKMRNKSGKNKAQNQTKSFMHSPKFMEEKIQQSYNLKSNQRTPNRKFNRRKEQNTQQKQVKQEVEQPRFRKENRRQQNRERKEQSIQSQRNQKRVMSGSKIGGNIEFRPDLRKDVNVADLLPQQTQQKNQIDTNELDGFSLQSKLKDSLIRSGVTKMTQIQSKCYETLFNGVDSVIKASTGSGKTLAYLIPLVNRLIKKQIVTKREDGTTIIIICPTRELCVQGQKQANRCLKRCPYIISGCLFGGQQTNHEKSRIRKGTNILFCTPGRVLYHLQQTQSFKLSNLQAVVFQEADRTLDMGFQDSVQKILNILGSKVSMSHIHKILVSAHFNSKVSSLLEQLEMNNPHFIGFENTDPQMEMSKLKQSKDIEINTSSQLKQQYVLMSEQQKVPLMLAYLGVLKNAKVLIFVSTIDEVEFFDYLLTNLKYKDSNGNETDTRLENRPVYKIHGDLDQKLRSKTYLQFRQSKEAILISTQVASRGLDFPDLSHIILFDVPPTITDYGNRVGRSARFNQTGVSLLMLHYIQSDYAQKIRYYSPSLQIIEKDIIYESYQKVLKSMNIGDQSLHYLEGLVRSSVKDDDEKYSVARKAYVSMLRAYARLPDRNIFAVKKLDLKLLARSFGLNNAQNQKRFIIKAKSSHLEASRKKRRVQNIKKLEVSQYL